MLSRTRLKRELEKIKDLTKDHKTTYLTGYIDGLRWVHDNYNMVTCPLLRVECGSEECDIHYKCLSCDKFHTRGSEEKE